MNRTLRYIVVGVGLLSYVLYDQNNRIVTTQYTYTSDSVPEAFDGMNIVHLSDLHNKTFKKDQHQLVSKVKQADPNLIFITGDIIDSRRYDAKPSLTLVRELVKLAVPVYYVTGNHEAKLATFDHLETELITAGVQVMRDQTAVCSIGTEHVLITGIDDPAFHPTIPKIDDMNNRLNTALQDAVSLDGFHLLLSHRPETLSLYAAHDVDIVFSGHAHGGQVRIPFVGGLFAPNQGFFPMYTAGLHTIDNTTMAVSRGLGNSKFPFRVFNRPEIVVVTLESTK